MNDWFEAEQRVERAQEFYESGRWEEALRELREALRVNPDNPEWHFNLGLTLEALGRGPEAIEAYRQSIDLQGESADSLNLLGAALLRDRQHAEALRCFERAERLDPGEPTSYANRIALYNELGEFEQADLMFYLALQADEGHGRAYFNMGQSQLDRGSHERALHCFEQVLRLDPGDEQVHGRLGDVHWARGELRRAYRSFIHQLRRQPGDVETLLDLGNLLIEMDQPLEAAEKFRRVIELEPANADAHHFLGELALRNRHPEAAEVALRRALQFDRRLVGVRTKLAMVALEQDRPDQARRLAKAELRLDNPEIDARLRDEFGQLLLDVKMPEEAARIYQQLADQHPDRARFAHQWAVALFVLGDLPGGLRVARRAIRADRRYTLAMHNLAMANLQLGRWRRALAWTRRGLAVDPLDKRLKRLRRKGLALMLRARLGLVARR